MNCVTHNHACDCREEKFAKIEAENKRLREALEAIAASGDDMANDGRVHADCCRLAKQALKEVE